MGAQPNKFRYSFVFENVRKEIIFAPEGWDTDTTISYKRDQVYFGIIRALAFPLEFVLDGADLLRKAYYTYGIEAEVRLEVEELQNSNWAYLTVFRGDVDFSQFKDFKDHVSVTLMESGVTRNVKAYDDVKYEYALTGDDVVNVILPGVKFSESSTAIFIPNFDNRRRFIPETQIATQAFKSEFVEVQNVDINNVNDGEFVGNLNWFAKSNRNQFVKVKGTFTGVFFPGFFGARGYKVSIMLDNAEFPLYYNNTDTGPFQFDFEINPLMIPEQRLYFYIRTDDNEGDQWVRVVEGEYTVSYTSVSDPSNCKGISGINLYKRIMARISPGSPVSSYLLTNTWKDLIFTSGDGIREIENAKIKISFNEFFETIAGIDNAAFGIENNTAVLELATYFARDIQILDLGEVKEFSLDPAQELIFNAVKVGYDDGNTDEDNGREEYNSGQVWALPITRIKKEMNWVSPTRADQYGIEKIRVDYNIKKEEATKKTNDTSSDNDTFMVYCYRDFDNYRPVLGSTYDYVEGLTSSESAYNLELTPKKNLLRHQAYLRSIMDRMDGRYINFASGKKNTQLVTVKNGIRVKEDENIISSSLQGKYFIPNIATITTKLPRNTMWLIDNLPFGYVTFKYNNVRMKGYIMEVSVDIARNTEREFKLLLTQDNNLLNLV